MQRLLVVAGLIRGKRSTAEEGLFLMSRRLKGAHLEGWWEFPGGKVELGESPVHALSRELTEELGITVRVGEVFAVGHHMYADREVVLLVYDCELIDGRPQCLEVMEYKWVGPPELCAMELPPADQPVIDRIRRDWDC